MALLACLFSVPYLVMSANAPFLPMVIDIAALLSLNMFFVTRLWRILTILPVLYICWVLLTPSDQVTPSQIAVQQKAQALIQQMIEKEKAAHANPSRIAVQQKTQALLQQMIEKEKAAQAK
jgi:hypothetical protein